MFLTSLTGELSILLFVAGNWFSTGSEQPLLQTLLSYGDVFLCQLFISDMWILVAQASSLGHQMIS